MENKLNEGGLQHYASSYSKVLSKSLFNNREKITGNEIIAEIPVSQVGLFVLYTLFKKWKAETAKLKSPYFDFSNEEVQQGLTAFMNLLSKHILIAQKDFEPLLLEAVQNTLLLIISPLNYYQNLVESFEGKPPTMDDVKDLQRFIKINEHMRDALLSAWAKHQTTIELFDKAFEDLTEPPQEVESLINPFNDLLALDLQSLVQSVQADEVAQELPSEENEGNDEAPLEQVAPDGFIEQDEQQEESPIFETLNDSFATEDNPILADSLGFDSSPNPTLKSMLTINQKFMFINDLFEGNNEDFNKVIDFLDSCATKDVVLKFIQSNYIQRGAWKEESPQVKEFMQLLNKRFSADAQ